MGINLENYDFSSIPDNFTSKTKIRYRCLVHDLDIERSVGNIKSSLCKQCSLDSRSKTLGYYLDKLPGITFECKDRDKIVKLKTKLKAVCSRGHEFLHTIGSNSGCPHCAGNVRETIDSLMEKINKKFPNKLEYVSGVYHNQHSRLIFRCLDCDREFESTGNRVIESVSGCASCAKAQAGLNRRKSQELFIQEVSELHNKYDYSKTIYRGASVKIDVICPLHGMFSLRAGDHLHNGRGCPTCGTLVSSKEKHLLDWIRGQVSSEVIENYRPDWLKLYGSRQPSELDIYIPALNLAIEYNGTYWHSERLLRDRPNYHELKYNLAKQNGIDLIHIFEFENLDKWKKRLANYLKDPKKYTITFSNEKRTIERHTVLGKTIIHKI